MKPVPMHVYTVGSKGQIRDSGDINIYRESCNVVADLEIPFTLIPGHIDFKRVEEIKQLNSIPCDDADDEHRLLNAAVAHVDELIQMLTGDKQIPSYNDPSTDKFNVLKLAAKGDK